MPELKPQVYLDERQAERFERCHALARTHDPDWMYLPARLVLTPLLEVFLTHAGAFPVRRGRRDEQAIATARSVLERDGAVAVYPQGGRSRDGSLGRPRPRIGRLALETGAPVMPVAIHGSLGIRRWERLRLPRVTIEYGAPITFPRTASQAAPSNRRRRSASSPPSARSTRGSRPSRAGEASSGPAAGNYGCCTGEARDAVGDVDV